MTTIGRLLHMLVGTLKPTNCVQNCKADNNNTADDTQGQSVDEWVDVEGTRLAIKYSSVNNFLTQFQNSQVFRHPGCVCDGVQLSQDRYLTAFCFGIKEWIQRTYHQDIFEIERACDHDGYRVADLARLLPFILKYSSIVDCLASLVSDIQLKEPKGTQIVQLFWHLSDSGDAAIQQLMQSALKHYNKVLMGDLVHWLAFGSVVNDNNGEFFIQLGGSTNLASSFVVRNEFLPPFISKDCAAVILEIGLGKRLTSRGSLPSDKCEHYERVLKEVAPTFDCGSSLFDPSSLLRVIYGMHHQTGQSLLTLVAGERRIRLIDELRLLKEFFFLGNGELFVSMLRFCGDSMEQPCTNKDSEHRLASALKESAFLIYGSRRCEAIVAKIRFAVDRPSTSFDGRSPSTGTINGRISDGITPAKPLIEMLSLHYHVSPPMDAVFSDRMLEKGCRVFGCLLRLRHAQMNVDRLMLISSHSFSDNRSRVLLERVSHLKFEMQFLLHSLQYFIHVDVLEACYPKVVRRLEHGCTTLLQAKEVVAGFVDNVFDHCCLGSVAAITVLESIFRLCRLFARNVTISAATGAFDGKFASSVNNQQAAFKRQSSLFYKALRTTAQIKGGGTLMGQLLTRLEFNSQLFHDSLYSIFINVLYQRIIFDASSK